MQPLLAFCPCALACLLFVRLSSRPSRFLSANWLVCLFAFAVALDMVLCPLNGCIEAGPTKPSNSPCAIEPACLHACMHACMQAEPFRHTRTSEERKHQSNLRDMHRRTKKRGAPIPRAACMQLPVQACRAHQHQARGGHKTRWNQSHMRANMHTKKLSLIHI